MMKSPKKVSRKKPAHRTRIRRSRVCRRRRRTKRGGMMRSAREVAGRLVFHDILPLIRAEQIFYHQGHEPNPHDGSITNANERFYRTFADIPIDEGIKDSI